MKSYRIGFLIIFFFAMASTIFAADYRGGEMVRVARSDTIPRDFFVGSRYVTIDGVVKSDVFATCERITVNGKVGDDVLAFCRQLTLHGKVNDQVLFFGESLIVDGEVDGDVLAFGGSVELTENAIVHGNVLVGTGSFNMEGGQVDGFIKGGAGRAFLNGKVAKSVELKVKNINFGSGYQAGGGTMLTLRAPLDTTKAGNIPADLKVTIRKPKHFYQRAYFYWSMAAMFVVGILMVAFMKNFVRDFISVSHQQALKNTGVGFVTLIVVPVAVVILLVLILTIPVSLMLLAIYFIVLYLSFVFTAFSIGHYFLSLIQKNGSAPALGWSLLLGVITVALLPKIPVVGWIIKLAIVCFGMGSLVIYFWQMKSKYRAEASAA